MNTDNRPKVGLPPTLAEIERSELADRLRQHAMFVEEMFPQLTTLARDIRQASTLLPGWSDISTGFPKGRKVLAGYRNGAGKWRTVLATYYPAGTLDSSDGNETEDGYAEEGWYEESETYEQLMPIDEPPTHWMPCPSEPGMALPSPPVTDGGVKTKDPTHER